MTPAAPLVAVAEQDDAPKLEEADAAEQDADAGTVAEVLAVAGLAKLGKDPPIDAVEGALRALAKLLAGADPLRQAAAREAAVQALRDAGIGSPSAMVDAALGKPAKDAGADGMQGRALALADPEPWPDAVDGAELLGELVGTFRRFLALPAGAPTALALWTLHAHAHDAAAVSPLLALTSPEKRCGKTTALSLLGALVPRSLIASNVTPAALFRGVEKFSPTLLVDEADSFLTGRNPNDELRGVLNSGHTRAGAAVIRCAGEDNEPRIFRTWCPKALALIGKLPPTLEDRAVLLQLRRRAPGETLEPLRLDRLDTLEPLRRKASRWAADNLAALRKADPDVPAGLHDRAADNWRPLLAIADAAGGAWPEGARKAAALLGGAADDGDAVGPMLLEDLRTIFEKERAARLRSAELVAALVEMEERPWPEWKHGKPLTVRQLARLLKPFGIGPKQGKLAGDKIRGYDRSDFTDAFARYLPAGTPPGEAVPPVPSSSPNGFPGNEKRYPTVAGTGCENGENPSGDCKVPRVPDENPPAAALVELGKPEPAPETEPAEWTNAL